jgi:hypothetical protein
MPESWGEIELEPEVQNWLLQLPDGEFGQAQFCIDLLESQGVLLGEPYTRQLRGKLRELRFYIGTVQHRITYYVATGRKIILLTVFQKDQRRAQAEIGRAMLAMDRCVEGGHSAED